MFQISFLDSRVFCDISAAFKCYKTHPKIYVIYTVHKLLTLTLDFACILYFHIFHKACLTVNTFSKQTKKPLCLHVLLPNYLCTYLDHLLN